MGCLSSKEGAAGGAAGGSPPTGDAQPNGTAKYSWDTQEKPDPKDFMLSELRGETVFRAPGRIRGFNFVIENLTDCTVYLCDNSDSITIDDCKNCRFFIGPVKGSVFFRDCTDCRVLIACQQFRTRDCRRFDVGILCRTQPIIEASSEMNFACLQLHYDGLAAQFEAASLSMYHNEWGTIHDFTPSSGDSNWHIIPEPVSMDAIVPPPPADAGVSGWSTAYADSDVPLSLGERKKPSEEVALVVFCGAHGANQTAVRSFLARLRREKDALKIVQTRDVKVPATHCERLFEGRSNKQALATAAAKGTVVGFVLCGDGCGSLATAWAAESSALEAAVTVSAGEGAAKAIEQFFSTMALCAAV